MNDLDLAAIRARADAATEGPWEVRIPQGMLYWVQSSWITVLANSITFGHDADFIAHAREDVPALLDALATMQGKLDEARRIGDNLNDERLNAIADLAARDAVIANVEALAAKHEHGALRWADPLPVPEWIPLVRAILAPSSVDPLGALKAKLNGHVSPKPCGHPVAADDTIGNCLDC